MNDNGKSPFETVMQMGKELINISKGIAQAMAGDWVGTIKSFARSKVVKMIAAGVGILFLIICIVIAALPSLIWDALFGGPEDQARKEILRMSRTVNEFFIKDYNLVTKHVRTQAGEVILSLMKANMKTVGSVPGISAYKILAYYSASDYAPKSMEGIGTANVSQQVEQYSSQLQLAANKYGVGEFANVLKALMMQESGGRQLDVMQASEGQFNTEYAKDPNSITDTAYSIECGVQEFKAALDQVGCKSPTDITKLQLALQTYNMGPGYYRWMVSNGYTMWTNGTALQFRAKMMQIPEFKNGYGDPLYPEHVLRYYSVPVAPTPTSTMYDEYGNPISSLVSDELDDTIELPPGGTDVGIGKAINIDAVIELLKSKQVHNYDDKDVYYYYTTREKDESEHEDNVSDTEYTLHFITENDPEFFIKLFNLTPAQVKQAEEYEQIFIQYGSTDYSDKVGSARFTPLSSIEIENYISIARNTYPSLTAEREDVLRQALALVGMVDYFWGGKSEAGWNTNWGKLTKVTVDGDWTSYTMQPYGLDCSGFVDWAYKSGGAPALPGSTRNQINMGTQISPLQLRPGDLGFGMNSDGQTPHHVLIYVGSVNGTKYWVHAASTKQGIIVSQYQAGRCVSILP